VLESWFLVFVTFRLEFLRKMKALNERSSKDEMMHNSEIKVLQRMIAHDGELKRFMSVKEHERLGHKADEVEKQAKMSASVHLRLITIHYIKIRPIFNKFGKSY